MEIKAKVALSLPNTFYKIILKYDTFQKATYDEYLIANLVINSNKKEAMKYIDEITGQGSLNLHFKKLYNKISDLKKHQVEGILKDSLFPVTMIDTRHHFKYYPMFDATRMDNKVYKGNIRDNEDLIKYLIMPQDEDAKFLSLEYEEEPGKIKLDTYDAIFSDNEIKVDLDNGNYCLIDKRDFNEVYKNDLDNLGEYLGEVRKKITDGNWNVLSKSIVNTFASTKLKYRDSCNVHTSLFNDFVKTTEIINVFGLFFYKETKYDFIKENSKQCEDAVKYLMESKNINEYKTKSLMRLLFIIEESLSQSVINYILGRKDSKEISEFAIEMIKSGLEKGWNKETLLSMKRELSSNEYRHLYKVDSDLGFDVEDILDIDDADLTVNDKERKIKYLSEKNNILKEIDLMIGSITNSGLREKIKGLEKSELKNKVKKFLDKRTGHNEKEYSTLNLSQLKKEYEEIKTMYNGEYKELLKIIKEN